MSYLKWPNPSQMRLILSLSLALISLQALAQNPLTQDGYIGLNDMLDLLSVYRQQYPESFYSDSTRAILGLGVMTYPECYQQACAFGKSWRVLSQDDFYYWFNYFLDEGQEFWEAGSSSDFGPTGWIRLRDGNPGRYGFPFRDDYENFFNGEIYNLDPLGKYVGYLSGFSFNCLDINRCVLATEALPEIEYRVIDGFEESAVSDSLSNGWKLQGGINSEGGQAIWKYVE